VEVRRGVDLGTQDGVELFGRHGLDEPVGQHPGGVHDPGDRVLREQCREGVAVGDVTRGHRDLGTQPGQLGDQVVDPRARGSSTADQQ